MIENVTLIDLTERNANHIIPSYCHLPVICTSLVDRYGYLGSCKLQMYLFIYWLICCGHLILKKKQCLMDQTSWLDDLSLLRTIGSKGINRNAGPGPQWNIASQIKKSITKMPNFLPLNQSTLINYKDTLLRNTFTRCCHS